MNGMKFKSIFENDFPVDLAYSWDNVGLQIGTLNKEVTKILVSLDLTLEIAEEAIKKGAELILVHHPLIFSGIKAIKTDSFQGNIIEKLIKNNIAVYVAHTNFDISNIGMNKILADILELNNQSIIEYTTDTEGLGRIGDLENPIKLKEYISHIKGIFHLDTVKLIGDFNKTIKRVAISGGSGSSIITKAKMQKADLYISGDITYHHALDAQAIGLNVLDVGHNIEKFSLKYLVDILIEKGVNCELILSTINTDPYKNV